MAPRTPPPRLEGAGGGGYLAGPSGAPCRQELHTRGCPMCHQGERMSILDGQLIPCPWCRATGRVSLERCRALRAQLRSRDEREAGT